MEYSTYVADSGIVFGNVFSDDFKTDFISIDLNMPLKKETAAKMALLSAVLKRGNTRFGEMDKVEAYLEQNYGAVMDITVSKTGEMQTLGVFAKFLDDRFAIEKEPVASNIIALLSASLFEPIVENGGFRADFVEQEKQNLKDRIAAIVNDKRAYSLERCRQVMFENESYGISELGDAKDIDAITPAELYEFYTGMLEKAMVMINYVGKQTDTAALLLPVTKGFGSGARTAPETEIKNSVESVKTVTERLNVIQSKLNLGFRLGSAAQNDFFAARLFNVIYGASPISKLFLNVRERLSLCYYCSGVCDSMKNVMFVSSGVEPENAEAAKKEILNQLDMMKRGEFSDDELENARRYLVDGYMQAYDSPGALASLQKTAYLMGHMLTCEQQVEQIKKVTRERIIAVARDITLDTVYLLEGTGGNADANNIQ